MTRSKTSSNRWWGVRESVRAPIFSILFKCSFSFSLSVVLWNTSIQLVNLQRRHEEMGDGRDSWKTWSIFLKKKLIGKAFCWHKWGFLRKWKIGFIREYVFLIREKWMDGEQHGKKADFGEQIHVMWETICFLRKLRETHFYWRNWRLEARFSFKHLEAGK